MSSKRIGFLTFLLWLVIPGAAFGQIPYWLDVSPGAVYQAPGSPSCFTITVGGARGHDGADQSDRATFYVRIGRAF